MPPPLLPQTRGGKRERDDGCTCPSTGTIIALGVCRSNAFVVEYQRRFTHEKHETALCQGTHGRQYFGSVAKFDFWAKSKNRVSGIQRLTDSQSLEKATLRQNPPRHT